MFDSHAHYDDDKFEGDRDEVIYTAHVSGVNYILNASVDVQSTIKSIELADKYDFIYASAGIHPHEAGKATERDSSLIYEIACKSPKVVAIGEIGLDYHYEYSHKEQQIAWFIRQIEIAKQLKLPVIIHNREAHIDTLDIIKSYSVKDCGGVLHCYSGSLEMLKAVLENNMSISVGGPVTFNNARKLTDVVKYVPFDKLLVETDCPYLSPEPFRGRRNDSSLIKFIIEKIASIKGVDFETASKITTQNAKALFCIDKFY